MDGDRMGNWRNWRNWPGYITCAAAGLTSLSFAGFLVKNYVQSDSDIALAFSSAGQQVVHSAPGIGTSFTGYATENGCVYKGWRLIVSKELIQLGQFKTEVDPDQQLVSFKIKLAVPLLFADEQIAIRYVDLKNSTHGYSYQLNGEEAPPPKNPDSILIDQDKKNARIAIDACQRARAADERFQVG